MCCPLQSITFVGAFLGKQFVSLLVKRWRCSAIIVLILGGLIAVSIIGILLAGAFDVHNTLKVAGVAGVFVFSPSCG